jgi:hypothetical protein
VLTLIRRFSLEIAWGVLVIGHAGAVRASMAQTVEPGAVWKPPLNYIITIHQDCQNLSFPALGGCFVTEMQRLGASQQAVGFAEQLQNEGFLRDLQRTGKVDVAYVYYPFRANENDGCLLVNGNPALINVDALDALPQSSMHRDPAYISLLAQYPKISIWPGDRSGKVDPVVVEILPDRTQRFIVHYRLRDGCHACAQIGQASFGFEFDRNGRFLQAEYFGIRAMDLKRPKGRGKRQ